MELILFISLLLAITVSPGPVNIALAGFGAKNGITRTMPFFIGVNASAAVVTLICALGIHELVLQHETIVKTIRYFGIAYIIYLSTKFFKPHHQSENSSLQNARFVDGFLLTVLNPKFYTMVVVVFSQSLTQKQGVAMISLLFLMTLLLANGVWLFFGVMINTITHNTKYDRAISYFFGIVLFLTAIGLLVYS